MKSCIGILIKAASPAISCLRAMWGTILGRGGMNPPVYLSPLATKHSLLSHATQSTSSSLALARGAKVPYRGRGAGMAVRG